MAVKKIWALFLVAFLLPALYSVQRPAERVETARPAVDDSFPRQTQEPVETTLYFPDYVDGAGWSVQLVISNVDPEAAAAVQVKVYDPDGQSVLDLFDSDLTFEIPALGSRILKSAGSVAIRRGWIQVEADAATVSGLLTYRHAQSGVEVGVKPVELGPQFALFVEESPSVGAGVAVFKPDTSPRLELRLRDEEGTDPLEGESVRWRDSHQAARTLPEWFDVEGIDTGFLRDFRGLLFLLTEDDSPFAPLGLRFGKGTSSLSAVPAIRTRSQELQETALIFPDYVDGGGWSVQLVLNNVDPDGTAEVRVEVYDPDGQPVRDLFDSDLTLEIPALGSRVLRSTGSGAIRRGWIQVETDAATVGGLLTYRDAQSGIEVGVEPVRLGHEFALFVEESETIGAGLALFKPEVASRIELRLRDEEGDDPLDGVYVPRRDFHQAARTLPEWFHVPGVDMGFLRDFRGLLFLRTEDESGFAPLGLRFGKGTSSLSAVPAIRIPEGSGIDGGQAPPPTVTLSASPRSIDRGRSTTLSWSSTNAESAEIEPGIGVVPTSGTRKVSPNVTTTYRITVTGADGQTATASVTVTVTVSERVALGTLYETLGGPHWTQSEKWLTDAPLGDWYGVEVDSQGRVTGLRLVVSTVTQDGYLSKTGIGLRGSIPAELGSLTHLEHLDLGYNELTGSIPAELGSLAHLEFLDLGTNALTGPIPAELGSLTNLRHLDLEHNELTGAIPAELGSLSNLEHLALDHNELTGSIPVELGSLTHLEYLGLGYNELTGAIPAELGALTNLRILGLGYNELTGAIPAALGSLAHLQTLVLDGNDLTGPVPSSFLGSNLENFWAQENATLCIPAVAGFVSWTKGLKSLSGIFCDESDRAILEALHEVSGGSGWTNSDGWRDDVLLAEWYGVRVDSLGRVTALDLRNNGLDGRLPNDLGELSQMIELRIGGNALSGRLPLSLARLSLRVFDYADTELCAPVEAGFQAWLNTLPSHEGSGVECAPLSEQDILAALYEATGGTNWARTDLWLTDAPLEDWHGVQVNGQGRVTRLSLDSNRLEGEIPPALGSLSNLEALELGQNDLEGEIPVELGSLSDLEIIGLSRNRLKGQIPGELGNLSKLWFLSFAWNRLEGRIPPALGSLSNLNRLDLRGNQLEGRIPARLGSLSHLEYLNLGNNALTGSIPAELSSLANLQTLNLGNNALTGSILAELSSLANLQTLDLGNNALTGSIPAELGSLANLQTLNLAYNELTGSVPAELGSIANLRYLDLGNNTLTGSIPAEFAGLQELREMDLTRNAGMSGALPASLTRLRRLEVLMAGETDLCVSSDARVLEWLDGVWKRRLRPCSAADPPLAYLTQAAQSREFPVPLVAGKDALLRVFVTAEGGADQGLPPVRAIFYRSGTATHEVEIPGKSHPIPGEVREGDLDASVNAEIPGGVVQPGLEMVIEIDPNGTLDAAGLGLTKRIPETGRLQVEVRAMPEFELTLIPFLWTQNPDSSILELVTSMAQDPESHESLWATRMLLPVDELDVTAHESVLSFTNDTHELLEQTRMIRAMEGASGHHVGMMSGETSGPAFGDLPGWSSVSNSDALVLAHELGHNLSLLHAPCPDPPGSDRSYPYSRGSIGVWGYDSREGGRLVPPARSDLMSYCLFQWISDYHFTNALRYRLHTAAGGRLSSLVAAPAESLLLWGGVNGGGAPFLEPAFAVEAPASLPRSTGEYEISGRSGAGDELFSLSFEMPQVADGDGRSSFAFVLPVQPDWADQLASITLSGPGGSVTLDQDTDRPVTILRNPRTGQIRGILRDRPDASRVRDDAVSALSQEPGMEVLTSRGIPDPDDWTR